MIEPEKITKAKYTDGPNADGYFTAGIDLQCLTNIHGEPDTHHSAIEFHSKVLAIAEARRDFVLHILQEQGLPT